MYGGGLRMKFELNQRVIHEGQKAIIWDYSVRKNTYSIKPFEDGDMLLFDIPEDAIKPIDQSGMAESAKRLARSLSSAVHSQNGDVESRDFENCMVDLYNKGLLMENAFYDYFIKEIKNQEETLKI